MTKLEISLDDLPKVISALQNMKNDLEKLQNDLPCEIAQLGLKYLDKKYLKKNKDPNIGEIKTTYRKANNSFEIVAYGDDVVYEEFGTGDAGENKPHPAKNKFNLKSYNSGGSILNVNDISDDRIINVLSEKGITRGNFWFYDEHKPKSKSVPLLTEEQKLNRAKYLIDHGDDVIISQGIKSGKEMWKTRNFLKSDKRCYKILKKKESDMIDKFVNTIKK